MTSFLFSPDHTAFLPINGRRAVFPVRRIFCVGQNYADHAREMGAAPARAGDMPFFFTKPAEALAHDGDALPYPSMTEDLQHEVELVAALDRGGFNIAEEDALNHVFGYTVGLDLTRRDLQAAAKKAGRPWDLAKGFDHAAPCGAIEPGPLPPDGAIRLSVNGDIRQDGHLSDMIWNVPQLISILSRFIALKPGDLLMTGTPSGVGPLKRGDKIDASIENLSDLSVTIK